MNGPFDTAAISSAGRRKTNMDAWMTTESAGIGCWAVADGLGGYAHSEQASRAAVDAVKKAFLECPSVDATTVEDLFRRANDAVLAARASRPELAQIATTLVVLVSDGHQAIWGHVGDSRLYLLRRGAVETRTLDHSVAQARLSSGHADVGEDARSSTALLKALGTARQVRPTISAPQQLYRYDAFLLCVDGFWEELHEMEMTIDLAKSRSAQTWLEFLASRVEERQRTGSDNYTAVVLRSTDPSLPEPPETGVKPGRKAVAIPHTAFLFIAALVVVLGAAGMGVVYSPNVLALISDIKTSWTGSTNNGANGTNTRMTNVPPGSSANGTRSCRAAWDAAYAVNSEDADRGFLIKYPHCGAARREAKRDEQLQEAYRRIRSIDDLLNFMKQFGGARKNITQEIHDRCLRALDALRQDKGAADLSAQIPFWDRLRPFCQPEYLSAEQSLSHALRNELVANKQSLANLAGEIGPRDTFAKAAADKIKGELAAMEASNDGLKAVYNRLVLLHGEIAALTKRLHEDFAEGSQHGVAPHPVPRPAINAAAHGNDTDYRHANLSEQERENCDHIQSYEDQNPLRFKNFFDPSAKSCRLGAPVHSGRAVQPKPPPKENPLIDLRGWVPWRDDGPS